MHARKTLSAAGTSQATGEGESCIEYAHELYEDAGKLNYASHEAPEGHNHLNPAQSKSQHVDKQSLEQKEQGDHQIRVVQASLNTCIYATHMVVKAQSRQESWCSILALPLCLAQLFVHG